MPDTDRDALAARFENHRPDAANIHDPATVLALTAAVHARTTAEHAVTRAVDDMRREGYSWAAIGTILGTTGQAAGQRYGGGKAGRLDAATRTDTGVDREANTATPRKRAAKTSVRSAAAKRVPVKKVAAGSQKDCGLAAKAAAKPLGRRRATRVRQPPRPGAPEGR